MRLKQEDIAVTNSFEKHDFPKIDVNEDEAGTIIDESSSFNPLFECCCIGSRKSESFDDYNEDKAGKFSESKINKAIERGVEEGRQAAIRDANSKCAGELIELLDCVLSLADQYKQRRTDLLQSSGNWIVSLAVEICRKITGHVPEFETTAFAKSLEKWVEKSLYRHMPSGISSVDALQLLISAGEMLMPCEQKVSGQLMLRIEKLRKINEIFSENFTTGTEKSITDHLSDLLKDKG